MTRDDLIAFEDRVAQKFNSGQIRAPVHLSSGNEDFLIDFFQKNVRECDWVLSSWRSHYHCLLKGVDLDRLFDDISRGRSISLCYGDKRVLCSGIVGGVVPIAVGIGMSIARRGVDERVFCFVGDMTSETGIFHESVKYVSNWNLPVTYVIEDNGKSVCTDTRKAWNESKLTNEGRVDEHVVHYSYDSSKWPHAGAGVRVQF